MKDHYSKLGVGSALFRRRQKDIVHAKLARKIIEYCSAGRVVTLPVVPFTAVELQKHPQMGMVNFQTMTFLTRLPNRKRPAKRHPYKTTYF